MFCLHEKGERKKLLAFVERTMFFKQLYHENTCNIMLEIPSRSNFVFLGVGNRDGKDMIRGILGGAKQMISNISLFMNLHWELNDDSVDSMGSKNL